MSTRKITDLQKSAKLSRSANPAYLAARRALANGALVMGAMMKEMSAHRKSDLWSAGKNLTDMAIECGIPLSRAEKAQAKAKAVGDKATYFDLTTIELIVAVRLLEERYAIAADAAGVKSERESEFQWQLHNAIDASRGDLLNHSLAELVERSEARVEQAIAKPIAA